MEKEWFRVTQEHVDVMRTLGHDIYAAEAAEGDWERLQAEYLSAPWSKRTRILGHWYCQLPTPGGRRLLTTCRDFPGARLIGSSRTAARNATAWVYSEFVVEERKGGRRMRDNFARWEEVGNALELLLVGPPDAVDADPDGPWVDDTRNSELTPAERMGILDAADPPVPYKWRPGRSLTFDITGHPDEGELGARLQLEGYGVDGYWWWWGLAPVSGDGGDQSVLADTPTPYVSLR